MKASSKKELASNSLRFSARLLFQFRIVASNAPRRRLCEERIITFTATHARAALAEARRRGRAGRLVFKNSDGDRIVFEFIGVMELLCLDPVCDPDEVWFRIVERVTPMERRKSLIPPEHQLNALRFA